MSILQEDIKEFTEDFNDSHTIKDIKNLMFILRNELTEYKENIDSDKLNIIVETLDDYCNGMKWQSNRLKVKAEFIDYIIDYIEARVHKVTAKKFKEAKEEIDAFLKCFKNVKSLSNLLEEHIDNQYSKFKIVNK